MGHDTLRVTLTRVCIGASLLNNHHYLYEIKQKQKTPRSKHQEIVLQHVTVMDSKSYKVCKSKHDNPYSKQ